MWGREHTAFLKPVSTGPEDEADDLHVERHAPGVLRRTLLQYDLAMSPHAAAKGKSVPSDVDLLSKVHQFASRMAARGPGWLFVETAGGVHSPGPSGTTQADLYAALRCPVVLVADSKLGGISLTISAFESLKIRGYDVETILVFRDDKYDNEQYLKDYFTGHHGIAVASLPAPPPKTDIGADTEIMSQYYEEESESTATRRILEHLDRRHRARIDRLDSMCGDAYKQIWYPFTQHKLNSPDNIVVIDSARGDFFQTLVSKPGATSINQPALQPSFDGSASWWTQGLGHGNPSLTMSAAYAAGRYGHVMFAGAIHEPALALAQTLLHSMKSSRLTRVFYSDNGSTGVEVAVKMALRAARLRYGWAAGTDIGIIGLKGGYHGDTIGAMDCAEPSTYNEKIEWYNGRGIWYDYPSVKCVRGQWAIEMPGALKADLGDDQVFESLSDVFDLDARRSKHKHRAYEKYIERTLSNHLGNGRKFGALLMEPVVVGAGGMELVDPLFQRALVDVVRRSAKLFDARHRHRPGNSDPASWSGLPVIFDEVFTGLYRLGRFTASSFLGTEADVSVHAKLLTGGLVPLSTTLASESIFKAFESDDKADALLHGHSYTAHPVGCQVALESMRQMQAMEGRGEWDWAKESDWSGCLGGRARVAKAELWSIWPWDLLDWVSNQIQCVAGTWALGSILAIHMKAADGTGYKSNAALKLQSFLHDGDRDGNASTSSSTRWNVHSRVLGNVLYIMGSQKTTQDDVAEIARLVQRALVAH